MNRDEADMMEKPLPATESQRLVVRADGSRASTRGMPTSMLFLSPEILEGLKQIAPKRRRSRARYVFAFGLLVALLWVGASPSARELLFEGVEPASLPGSDEPRVSAAPPASTEGERVAVPAITRPADTAAATQATLPAVTRRGAP